MRFSKKLMVVTVATVMMLGCSAAPASNPEPVPQLDTGNPSSGVEEVEIKLHSGFLLRCLHWPKSQEQWDCDWNHTRSP